MKVIIVDEMMGRGKTSAAINLMNSSDNDERFMYVTPYISEVERVIKSCPQKKFKQPENKWTKIMGIKMLLDKGSNIATTHSLFHLFDDEIIETCRELGYTLIMDEVTSVVENYEIMKDDANVLLEKYVDVDEETGILRWRESQKDYNGEKFAEEKRLCEMESLAMYGDTIIMWLFPVKIFKAFHTTYILTYLFDGQLQKGYYDFHNIKYEYMHVGGNSVHSYHFQKEESPVQLNILPLINIIEDEKLNMVGSSESSLSKTWYLKNKKTALTSRLKNNLYSVAVKRETSYNNETGDYEVPKSKDVIWTTFKDMKDVLKGKGYTKGFIPCNARATNEYRERNVVAYLINVYINPTIKNFFTDKGIIVDEDLYATSEMIQLIWRSAIRDGKHITVYIPSIRMRTLLHNWLAEVSCSN